MQVLYITSVFPDPAHGATIYTDLAEALHEAGHEITVVVADQASHLNKTQIKKERGFDVLRVITGNYYDVGLIEKGITALRIPLLVKKGIAQYLRGRTFDFILFEAPPVTVESLVKWAKKMFSCPSYLMLKDIFPQNAADLGIMQKTSLIYKYFKYKEKKLYESADLIGCMSEANKKYLVDHYSWLNQQKIEIFPNTKKIRNVEESNLLDIRRKYAIPDNKCVILFGGNMGKPQYVDLLCKAIIECRHDEKIFFLFVGRGTDRSMIEQSIEKEAINNAKVIGNLPRDHYEELIMVCDIGLIILDPRFTIPNYPSRILSYMEYSKPVIAATDMVTDIKDLIEQSKCGEWVWSGNKAKFIEAIRKMVNNQNRSQMGRNGRDYLERHFNVQGSINILEKHFEHTR